MKKTISECILLPPQTPAVCYMVSYMDKSIFCQNWSDIYSNIMVLLCTRSDATNKTVVLPKLPSSQNLAYVRMLTVAHQTFTTINEE